MAEPAATDEDSQEQHADSQETSTVGRTWYLYTDGAWESTEDARDDMHNPLAGYGAAEFEVVRSDAAHTAPRSQSSQRHPLQQLCTQTAGEPREEGIITCG